MEVPVEFDYYVKKFRVDYSTSDPVYFGQARRERDCRIIKSESYKHLTAELEHFCNEELFAGTPPDPLINWYLPRSNEPLYVDKGDEYGSPYG